MIKNWVGTMRAQKENEVSNECNGRCYVQNVALYAFALLFGILMYPIV